MLLRWRSVPIQIRPEFVKELLVSSLLVAGGAVDRSFVLPMAFHAGSHRDIRFAEKSIALLYVSVTGLARCAARQVRCVAEIHVARNLINARPGDITILQCEVGECFDCRAVLLD